MEFEFDPAKDETNRQKHGYPLSFGQQIVAAENVLMMPTIRPEDGEERFKAVAMIEGRLFSAIFTWRGETMRLISVRKSNANEQNAYRNRGGPR